MANLVSLTLSFLTSPIEPHRQGGRINYQPLWPLELWKRVGRARVKMKYEPIVSSIVHSYLNA